MELPDELAAHALQQPYPLLFATLSGAHLYGFPSPDSDFDLRGVHLLPAQEVLGLHERRETLDSSSVRNGMEIDLVTHDAEKFFKLMLKKNGYVLEQLYSPLTISTGPLHDELKELGRGCITRHHDHHYRGFAENQRRLLEKEQPPRLKPLLYLYRVLLTGIHLMTSGDVEANLTVLNDRFKLDWIDDLVARKSEGHENATLRTGELDLHRAKVAVLFERLDDAAQSSSLPDKPSARDALSDFLVRLRLAGKIRAD